MDWVREHRIHFTLFPEVAYKQPPSPRDRDNVRHGDKPFAFQARMTLDNLEAAANAAGLSLKDAVKVSVFLRNPADAKEFDAIYDIMHRVLSEASRML